MKFTRARLLAAAKAAGYTGEATLDAIKAWLSDPNDPKSFNLGDGVTVDQVWANNPAKSLTIADDPGDDDDAKPVIGKRANSVDNPVKAADADAAADDGRKVRNGPASAALSARKAYNRNRQRPEWSAKRSVFEDADMAEAFGAWARLRIAGRRDYPQKANDLAIVGKANTTTSFTGGGATVPGEMAPYMIELLESYGAARKWIGVTNMSGDVLNISRLTSDVTIGVPGEAVAATESNPAFDAVNLVARNYVAYTTCSMEWLHDSAVNAADLIARSFARAYAKKEDQQVALGDGSNTYNGVVGVPGALNLATVAGGGTWPTNGANLQGAVIGGTSNNGASHDEIVTKNLLDCVGRVMADADTMGSPAWMMHKSMFWALCMNLKIGLGGATPADATSKPLPELFGYPVIYNQAMPRYAGATDLVNQIPIIFGAGSLGAKIGVVNGSMSFESNDSVGFASSTVAFRGMERKAIVVHDVGDYNATAASRNAGPIAYIKMHTS